MAIECQSYGHTIRFVDAFLRDYYVTRRPPETCTYAIKLDIRALNSKDNGY